jgi:uncharacterized UPF0160 family protein
MTETNQKYSIDFNKEDLIYYYYQKFILEWVENNHSEFCEKVKRFLEDEIKD